MDLAKAIKKAKSNGYEVEETSGPVEALVIEGETVREALPGSGIYRVTGHGIDVQYAGDDEEAWERLNKPQAHDHRMKDERVRDPEDDYELTDEELFRSSVDAAVAVGDLNEEDAQLAVEAFLNPELPVEEPVDS